MNRRGEEGCLGNMLHQLYSFTIPSVHYNWWCQFGTSWKIIPFSLLYAEPQICDGWILERGYVLRAWCHRHIRDYLSVHFDR